MGAAVGGALVIGAAVGGSAGAAAVAATVVGGRVGAAGAAGVLAPPQAVSNKAKITEKKLAVRSLSMTSSLSGQSIGGSVGLMGVSIR